MVPCNRTLAKQDRLPVSANQSIVPPTAARSGVQHSLCGRKLPPSADRASGNGEGVFGGKAHGEERTGAFLLAEADLLDGRHATTHWRFAGSLQVQFPRIRVEADRIFVKDENVWTSAGVSAGIDLALAMIEEDCG